MNQLFSGRRAPQKSVLVVDDEAAVCRHYADGLEDAGFRAVCAGDYASAKRLMATERFDALVTDVNLGGDKTGFDLAREARDKNPRIGVMFVSGDSPLRAARANVPDAVVLMKPCYVEDISSLLEDLLERIDDGRVGRAADAGEEAGLHA